MTVRGYQLAGDWNNDGLYTGTHDDVTSQLQPQPELVVEWGREEDLTSPATTVGEMAFNLNNYDRKFSPENGSSPIAGLVRAGRKVRLRFTTGGTFDLFEGVIDRFKVDPSAPARTFTAQCLDMWGRPNDENLSTPLYEGIRTGDAINLILDEIDWPGTRDIDPGATVMPYWWAEGEDAATAVEMLINSEGPPAVAYVKGGQFVFRDRHHRLTRTASQTSQATFTNVITPAGTGPGGSFKIEKATFDYDHGLEHVINSVSFTVEERAPVDPGVVWETQDPIVVPASGSTVLHIQAEDPFRLATAPVAGTDFTVVSGSTPTVTLSRTSGRSLIINLAGGVSAAVLDGMRLRATSIPVAHTIKVSAEDATSITAHQGRQAWPHDAPWANRYDAQVIADRIVATWKDPRPRVVFTVPPFTSTYRPMMLARAISDRVTVRDDTTGANDDYIIERIRHTITQLNVHRLTLWCQLADAAGAANYLTFGASGKGFGQGVFGP